MSILETVNASASPEIQINRNFETLQSGAVYGKRAPVTTGLTWGYCGGRWGGILVAEGVLTLTASSTNHIVVNRVTGLISVSTATTYWDDTANYARVYRITTGTTTVSTEPEDHRQGTYGIFGGGGAGSSGGGGGAGGGVKLYPSNVDILADSANTIGIDTLAISASELTPTVLSVTVNNSTAQMGPAYQDGAIGANIVAGGEWTADLYRYVDATGGSTRILTSIYIKAADTGTVTITGTGTSRTATITGGTPFVAGDVNADASKSSWLYTPAGQFRITAYTSSTVVTIETKSGYSNESAVAYSKDAYYTQADTGDINETSATNQIVEFFANDRACNTTDLVVVRFWAKTDASSNRAVYLKFGGAAEYSHLHTPLRMRHNDLNGKNDGDYQHLTVSEKSALMVHPRGVGSFVSGKPIINSFVIRFVCFDAFTIASGFAQNYSKSTVAATAQTDFAIKKNGTTIGTLRYAAAANSATFIDVAMPASFSAGDILEVIAPAVQDSTLANISTTIIGFATL